MTVFSRRLLAAVSAIAILPALCSLSGCGSASATTTTSTTTGNNTSTGYDAVYKATNWGSNVTATFPTTCTMTLKTTGVPAYHAAYYLAPVTGTGTVVATTPSGLKLGVIAYTSIANALGGSSTTYNICPSKAATTTATNMGSIGMMISGVAMFNAYEATGTVAVSDNVSYTFTDTSGNSQTASFLDDCSGHSNGGASASATWHYHAVPTCVTSLVDTATGPSHLIGIAMDGFPIYGGRDINGAVIDVSKLDACNGITSATPEFPDGKYHYVLPIGVTTKQSSLGCYAGSVTVTQVAIAERAKCDMKNMKATKGM
ncbi:YHYH protein [Granulicella pectinivorans]|jgi:hypothetical protein|uniref:YHYH protein n=1 Tax=Granulicella pectinivorans TaxID=474950 RepID=A0A1I6MYF9_9BACT|nr:YHYH protein [Granulicella pectinivorans]SFS20740.1 YHYH protein [Granulicella pectinivorans]